MDTPPADARVDDGVGNPFAATESAAAPVPTSQSQGTARRRKSMSISHLPSSLKKMIPVNRKRKSSKASKGSKKRKSSTSKKAKRSRDGEDAASESTEGASESTEFTSASTSVSTSTSLSTSASVSASASTSTPAPFSTPIATPLVESADSDTRPSRARLARTKTIRRGLLQQESGTQMSASDDPVWRDIGARMKGHGERAVKQASQELEDMRTKPRPRVGWTDHVRTGSLPPARSASGGGILRYNDKDLDDRVKNAQTAVDDLERTVTTENIKRVVDATGETSYTPARKRTQILIEPRLVPSMQPRVRIIEQQEDGAGPREPKSVEMAREIGERNPHYVEHSLRPSLTAEAERADRHERKLEKRQRTLVRTVQSAPELPRIPDSLQAGGGSAREPDGEPDATLPAMPSLPELPHLHGTRNEQETEDEQQGVGEQTIEDTDRLVTDLAALLDETDRPSRMGAAQYNSAMASRVLNPYQWDEFIRKSYDAEQDVQKGSSETGSGLGSTSDSDSGTASASASASASDHDTDEHVSDSLDVDHLDAELREIAGHDASFDVFSWRGLEKRLERQLRSLNRRSPGPRLHRQLDVLRFAIAELQSDQEHRARTQQQIMAVQLKSLERVRQEQQQQHRTLSHVKTQGEMHARAVHQTVATGVRHLHQVAAVQGARHARDHEALISLLEEMVTQTSETHKDIRVFAQTYHDQQGIFTDLLAKNQQQLNQIYDMHASQMSDMRRRASNLEARLDRVSSERDACLQQNQKMRTLVRQYLPHLPPNYLYVTPEGDPRTRALGHARSRTRSRTHQAGHHAGSVKSHSGADSSLPTDDATSATSADS